MDRLVAALPVILTLTGAVLLPFGAFLIYPPAGVLLAGGEAAAAGLLLDFDREKAT